MACSVCIYLECALTSRHTEYIAACTEAFRQISSKLEAYRLVEMERALSDLQMHRSACHSAHPAAVAQLPLKAPELNLVALVHLAR